MKYLKYVLFFFLMMLPSIVFAAFDPDSNDCDLDEIVNSGYDWGSIICTYITVKSTDNLNFFDQHKYSTHLLYALIFDGVDIQDMSFIDDINLDDILYMEFKNSNLNLKKFPDISGNKLISIYFSEVNIVDDDFSKIIYPNVYFEFRNCWLKDLSSMKNKQVRGFGIVDNKSVFIDLSPLLTITPGIAPDIYYTFAGSEQNVTKEIIDYLESFVDGSTRVFFEPVGLTASDDILEDFYNLYNSIDLNGKSAEDQIKNIVIKVIDSVSSCSYSGYNYIEKALMGCGTSREYSYLTAALLQKAGFSAYVMNGYTNSSNKSGTATYWVNIYYKGTWRGIDVYNLDNTTGRQNVVDGTYTPYYLGYVDDSDFSYNHMTDSKINVLIDESLTIKFIDGVEDKVMSLPVSLEHYVLPTPIKEGYTFDGWYLENTYVTKVSSATELKKNGNLYAKWTKNPETPVIEETEREVDGPIPNPESGIFVGLFIVLPILMLFGLEYLKNKNNSKVYKI